jgi:HPt (histidine-containing phosphotransfer) domain-containing protein
MHERLPLLDEAHIAMLREAVGDEDLRAMFAELPDATRQALDAVRAAVASDDAAGARHAAHTLKGVASSFGAARLAALACELEHPTSSITAISQGIAVLDDLIEETSAALDVVGSTLANEAGT